MANRKRPIRLKFRVTEAEKKKIQKRMAQAKIDNQEAYVRKMAIDGYIVNLEIPGLKELSPMSEATANVSTRSPSV